MANHFTIIAATSPSGGIGINGQLPWRNKTDMKYFRNLTTQRIDETKINAVIMGRKTCESLNYKPLPNRLNICITSRSPATAISLFTGKSPTLMVSTKSMDFGLFPFGGNSRFPGDSSRRELSLENDYNVLYPLKNILFFNSLNHALKYLYKLRNVENIFVIGGAMLYTEAIDHKDCHELVVNEIDCQVDCDAFFPEIDTTKYILTENRDLTDGVQNRRYIHKRFRCKTF
jgi:dihydrofolate reductase